MNLRNVLKQGEYATVVPVGIPCSIEYDDRGILQHVYLDFYFSSDTKDDEIKDIMYQEKKIPGKITIKSGTTWVQGIIYSGHKFRGEGAIPQCLIKDAVSYLESEDASFNFFACGLVSQAMRFKGVQDLVSWFAMNHFNALPGFVVPVNVNEALVKSILTSKNFQFDPNMVMNYVIISDGTCDYKSIDLYQFQVEKVEMFEDEYGTIKNRLYSKSGEALLSCDISEVYSREIHESDYVMFNKRSHEIVCSFRANNKRRSQYPSTISCPFCGNVIQIPKVGSVACSDLHCVSRLFTDVHHFTHKLNLPSWTYDEYLAVIKENPDFRLSEIFKYYPYDGSCVECTLADVLEAATPVSIVSNPEFFKDIVVKCNNSVDSVRYNLAHPERINYTLANTDSDLATRRRVARFVEWLKDVYNQDTLISLISDSHIQLTKSIKKFDGEPIFRNKKILITGKFVNGNLDDIASILASYSAEVVRKFEPDVDCIVTGGQAEDINGTYLRQAKLRNIPVYDELSFFKTYEIDQDLVQNLL